MFSLTLDIGNSIDVDVGFNPLGHHTAIEDRKVVASLVSALQAEVVVEVGTYVGMTAIAMAKAVPGVQVHCIDSFGGNPTDRLGNLVTRYGRDRVFRTLCDNLGERLYRTVHPHAGTSAFFASMWPWPVDLVFIDADHRYGSVKEDIAAWTPHVKPGGILCGHDYVSFPGVRRAADEAGVDGSKGDVWWKYIQ